MQKIAVIGSGISGLGAAHRLARRFHVTLFEAAGHLGGHAHTVDVTLDGVTHGVDTGFLVFNHKTYPNLLKLFNALDVPTAKADMGFSVKVSDAGIEWCGSSLSSVFAQRGNLLKPRFLRMLGQIMRFNRQAIDDVAQGTVPDVSLQEYLLIGGYSRELIDWYLLPMAACVWSCPADTMLQYPARTFLTFCGNHGLLQGFEGRPQWYTVRGGSREYVKRIAANVQEVRLNTPVQQLTRNTSGKPGIRTAAATESFDAVVLATHSDTALALLAEPSAADRQVLSKLRYQPNRAVLHTDASVLPRQKRAWAAWNYESASVHGAPASVCCHYLINKLQPLPFKTPVIVSLNPVREPSNVIGTFAYDHPVFDAGAIAAQQQLASIQGQGRVWFAGAWANYGFHEDGLVSGLAAASAAETFLTLPTLQAALAA
jgi:uncharacterized protein